MRITYLLLVCLCSNTAFSQVFEHKLDMKQISAVIAKAAATESLEEDVAVFLTEPKGQKQGIEFTFSTTAKFAIIRAANANQDQQKVTKSKLRPNTWFLFGNPGKYSITVIESDPEKGLDFIDAKFTIQGSTEPDEPDKPIDPPAGDFVAITKASKDTADKLNDPTTRSALKTAYSSTIPLMKDKTYEECRTLVVTARFSVLNARQGLSRTIDWESWKIAVDIELKKLVNPGDSNRYIKAVEAIVAGL